MFKGPTIFKLNGGRGAEGADKSKVFGLVAGAVAVSGTFVLGTAYKLIQLSDAVALGINAAYDSNNGILLYYHIKQHFKFNPETTLFLMGVAQTRTQAQMWDLENTSNSVKALFDSEIANKTIRVIGTVRNPLDEYEPDNSDGIDVDSLDAGVNAQALIDDYATSNIYIDAAIIDGRNFVSTNVGSVIDLRTLNFRNVSICVTLDPAMEEIDSIHKESSSVGSVLGAMAERSISESIGSTVVENPYGARKASEVHSLTSVADESFITARLTGGRNCNTLSNADHVALKTKGYIYADSYPETDGVFFVGGPTCVELTDDYSFIEYNRVWNEAARILVRTSIPKYNAKVLTREGGLIDPNYALRWQEDINAKLKKQLTDANHVSKAVVLIELTQNVVSSSKVQLKLKIRPMGYSRDIEGYIGFDVTI